MMEGLLDLRKFFWDYCNCENTKKQAPTLILLVTENWQTRATDPEKKDVYDM
jgi:hypothetical protein